MMTGFFLCGLNEYKRQIELQKSFQKHSEQVNSILRRIEKTNSNENSFEENARCRMRLLLLMPLVEVAWADGRVTRREMDVIINAADVYGLVDNVGGYSELMERLLSRPAPQTIGRVWRELHNLLCGLPRSERNKLMFCLISQAKFVAEQSSESMIGFLRGERICEDENLALRAVVEQFNKIRKAAENTNESVIETPVSQTEKPRETGIEKDSGFSIANREDYEKLIPVVPLVKTAWAEGRITKKERYLIFEAAARHGIKPDSTSYKRLCEWLELHPTDEFFEYALGDLTESWKNLDADEKKQRKFDILSDCTKIAEASGGSKKFPAGGMKICDEEIAVVKRIAQKISSADAV